MSKAAAVSSKDADDDYGKDSEYKGIATKAYKKLFETVGTLANRKVYVSVSTLVDPIPMLGLFANERFDINEPVVVYGGELMSLRDAKNPNVADTHIIRIPDSHWVRDGRSFAGCFPIKKSNDPSLYQSYRQEMTHPISERVRVQPTHDNADLCEYIRTSGIGYMANRPSRGTKANVVMASVDWNTTRLAPQVVYYAARVPIRIGDEIVVDYKKHSPDREGTAGVGAKPAAAAAAATMVDSDSE